MVTSGCNSDLSVNTTEMSDCRMVTLVSNSDWLANMMVTLVSRMETSDCSSDSSDCMKVKWDCTKETLVNMTAM
jgi:hypothetical protein